jgi:glutathione S-transferase
VGNTTEHIAQEVRDKNPLEQIPVLEFTDPQSGEQHSLTQSLAIIEYLEEAYPAARKVLSTCPLRRARARQVSGCMCCFRPRPCSLPLWLTMQYVHRGTGAVDLWLRGLVIAQPAV